MNGAFVLPHPFFVGKEEKSKSERIPDTRLSDPAIETLPPNTGPSFCLAWSILHLGKAQRARPLGCMKWGQVTSLKEHARFLLKTVASVTIMFEVMSKEALSHKYAHPGTKLISTSDLNLI